VAKRAGRYLILGTWLLEWIEAGELPRRKPDRGATMNSNGAKAEKSDG
jgi:hypothetical protein